MPSTFALTTTYDLILKNTTEHSFGFIGCHSCTPILRSCPGKRILLRLGQFQFSKHLNCQINQKNCNGTLDLLSAYLINCLLTFRCEFSQNPVESTKSKTRSTLSNYNLITTRIEQRENKPTTCMYMLHRLCSSMFHDSSSKKSFYSNRGNAITRIAFHFARNIRQILGCKIYQITSRCQRVSIKLMQPARRK